MKTAFCTQCNKKLNEQNGQSGLMIVVAARQNTTMSTFALCDTCFGEVKPILRQLHIALKAECPACEVSKMDVEATELLTILTAGHWKKQKE